MFKFLQFYAFFFCLTRTTLPKASDLHSARFSTSYSSIEKSQRLNWVIAPLHDCLGLYPPRTSSYHHETILHIPSRCSAHLILPNNQHPTRSDRFRHIVSCPASRLCLYAIHVEFVGVTEWIIGLQFIIVGLNISPTLLTMHIMVHLENWGISLCQAQYLVPFLHTRNAFLPRWYSE